MKVEIDWRPDSKFYGIRLFPETNEEMADLERFISVNLKPDEIIRIVNTEINYLVKFKK